MNLAEYREVRLDGDMCLKRLRDSVHKSDGKGREGQCREWEKRYLQFLGKRRRSRRTTYRIGQALNLQGQISRLRLWDIIAVKILRCDFDVFWYETGLADLLTR